MGGQKEVSIWVSVNDALTSKFKTMESSVGGFENKLNGAYSTLVAFGSGALLGGLAGGLVKSSMDWGKAVANISEQTGASGEESSKLLVIAKRTGLGMDEASGFMSKFGKAVSMSKDEMQAAAVSGKQSNDIFSRMGMTLADLDNKSLYEVFQKVATYMRGMGDGADKDRVAMELFGRAGRNMYDMLNMGTAEMQSSIDKAQQMGLIISGETAGAWKQFDRQLTAVQGTASKLAIGIGNELLPSLQKLLDATDHLVGSWLLMDKSQRQAAAGIIEIGASFGIAVGGAFAAVKSLAGLRGAYALLTAFLAANPITVMVVATGLVAANLPQPKVNVDDQGRVIPDLSPAPTHPPAAAGSSWADLRKTEDAGFTAANAAAEAKLNELRKTAGDVNMALSKVRGDSLKEDLDKIDKQAAAFRASKQDEVKITQWAEEAKNKAVKDAMDKRYGPEFAAVKAAMAAGNDPGAAYDKAHEQHMKDDKIDYDANEFIRKNKLGIYLPGDMKTDLNVDTANNTITGTRRRVTDVEIPAPKPGQPGLFENYRPGTAGAVNITVSPTINVSAITPETKQQITDDVADALTQALGKAQNLQTDSSY